MVVQPAILRLLEIMQQLRDPISGCEWDKKQTYASITIHTLEETYEVIDAIERQNFQDLKTELGDLLFQVIFYAQLAKEDHHFDFDDVCHTISDKLERRHPHIFLQQAQVEWEIIKKSERKHKDENSVLDDIPAVLPALMRAEKMQQRCATVGFDWQTLSPVIAKIEEELGEVKHEIRENHREKTEDELGDLLFSVINLVRYLGFKSETVLQKANKKFEQRFRQVESIVASTGGVLANLSLDELEQIWQKVKRKE